MGKLISGRSYGFGVGLRLGVFVIVSMAYPWLVQRAITSSGAHAIDGASGALALVIGLYAKPFLYLCLVCSLAGISFRRAKSIGMAPMIGLCIPLLLLADFSFGINFGSSWASNFVRGFTQIWFPASLVCAAIAAVTLSLLTEDRQRRMMSYRIWTTLLFVSLATGTVSLVSASARSAGGEGIPMLAFKTIAHLQYWLLYPYGLLTAFAVVSIVFVLDNRRYWPFANAADAPARE